MTGKTPVDIASATLTRCRDIIEKTRTMARQRIDEKADLLYARIEAKQKEMTDAADEQKASVASTVPQIRDDLLADANTMLPPKTPVGTALDEWKECRATIDRCDKLLVDLRKTGFGFVTAVVAAANFLFKDDDHAGLKVAVACMLVVLIILLYVVDLAHQAWLSTAVGVATQRESEMKFSITTDIGKNFSAAHAEALGFSLYAVLLFATCAIFWCSIPLKVEHLLSGHRGTLYGALAAGLFAMIISLGIATKGKYGKIIILGAIFVYVMIGALLLLTGTWRPG